MVLQRWSPLSDIRRVERDASRFWRAFGGKRFYYRPSAGGVIPLDVEKGDKKVTVSASLPGLSPEDIEVTTQDGVLTIKAESQTENEASEGNYAIRERRNDALHRSLRLSSAVDADNAEASYEHGVLTVSLPKHEASKPRHLEVKTGS